MMKYASIVLLVAWCVSTALGTDYRADLETVQRLLAQDASFSTAERQQAESAFTALRQRADGLSAAAFQLEVARLFALAHNGHTMLVSGLWPSQFNRIPVRTQVFADGVFIIEADDSGLIGHKLLALDGHAIEFLRQRFSQFWGAVPAKRDDWLGYWLESPELLHAAGLAEHADRLTLHLADGQGKGTTATVRAAVQPPAHGRYAFFYRSRLVEHQDANLAPNATTPLYLAEADKLFRYAPLPHWNAFYLQLRYNNHVGQQRVNEFAEAATAAIRERKPARLIVDLRLDGGGDLNTTRDLMQILPTLLPENGQIFAIASGRTFSAGIASLGYLKQAGTDRVVIVGEPIGDELEYWAEGSLTELPVSKAEVMHATERHNYQTGCPEPDCHGSIRRHPIRVQGLAPDLLTPLRYEDYRRGIDPAFTAIAAHIERGPNNKR